MTRFLGVLLFGVFAVGCAGAGEDEDLGETTQAVRGQHIPHPQGAYEATIRASGTGCPDGTWSGALSSDGETFTVTFSAYEAIVSPGKSIAMKDCTLDVDFGSAQPIQFAVSSFYYQGYLFLEKPGMTARHEAKYQFPSLRERNADKDEVRGPFDNSYLFTDTIAPANREWTRCKRKDSLRIKTRMTVKNDPGATAEGYMNTESIDGTLKFAMKWRRCTA